MKVQEVILKAISKEITWIEAAEILRRSPRQIRRMRERYERQGYDGLFDRRTRRPSPRRVPLHQVESVLRLYRERYFDFNVTHFHEKLTVEHGFSLSYTWVKSALHAAGLVAKRKKNVRHRRRRERRPLRGIMLHLDGSTHSWFGPDHPSCDLLVVADDATSEVYDARFVREENTRSVMGILRAVIEKKGIFCSLYSDRASHFVFTPKAGERPDRNRLTQVARALGELGIELIPANSPQARGRGERLFGTWQGRLPQELRLARITTMEEGNRYLRDTFIRKHNAAFVVRPAQPGHAFVSGKRMNLDRIFSIHRNRTVAGDNTIQVGKKILQIPKSHFRTSFTHCRVKVYEHLDGTMSIGLGSHELGRYDSSGKLLKLPERRKAA